MSGGSIRLSKKHGLNPSVLKCWICGGDAGLALLGQVARREDGPGSRIIEHHAEAPREMTRKGDTCSTCEGVMKSGGIMLVEVRDGEGGDDPYRTGRVWGLSKQWADRVLKDFTHTGMAYVPENTAKQMGLHAHPKN